MEKRMAFVGRGPLGTGQKVLPADVGRIGAAARLGEAVNESLLLGCGNWFHSFIVVQELLQLLPKEVR
jgi:hypothetical protein